VTTPPPQLGRGAIIRPGQEAPHPIVVRIDRATIAKPEQAVDVLHRHWASREPVTVILDVDQGAFKAPASIRQEPYTLSASFLPPLDRLHFLVWNNNVDLRSGSPVWWWGIKAEALGAGACTTGDGDVVLPDGETVWIDGGPRDVSLASGLRLVHCETVEAGLLSLMPPYRSPVAELAPDQLAAVAHGAGPARIVAPAGSGKTRVLVERLMHLIRDRGYEADSVLALAYNKRAQLEMEARVTVPGAQIRTVNSLAFEICRRVVPGIKTIDDSEVRDILEPLLPHLPRRANTDPMAAYLEALGEIRLGLRTPAEVEEARDDVGGIAEAFAPFRSALRERGVVDYNEQIYASVEALLQDGTLRRSLQRRYRHLLVDEFQDLRPLHLLLIRLIASPALDVFGVGDDDQVIYGYDGANPRFLIDFDRFFPAAAPHPLTVNYRCPEPVVVAATTLLSHNRTRIEKTIHPGPGAVTTATALTVLTPPLNGSASAIVETVQGGLDTDVTLDEIAILARVNSTLVVPQVALQEAGIAVQTAVTSDILNRTGTRAVLAYLRIARAEPDQITARDLNEIAKRPSRGLTNDSIAVFQRRRRWSLQTLRLLDLGARQNKPLIRFIDDVIAVRAGSLGKTTAEVMALIRNGIGLQGAMELLSKSGRADNSSHLDDLDAMTRLAELHPEPATFEDWLREILSRPSDPNGILLATVHKVKGQEWDHVLVVGADDGLMPHRLSADIEEERRIFHVAITRCRKSVTVMADGSRPSPFLREMRERWKPPVPVPIRDRQKPRPLHAARTPRGIVPAVGMTLVVAGGYSGTVAEISEIGVSLETSAGGTLLAKFGETVTADGVSDVLLASRPDAASGLPARSVEPATASHTKEVLSSLKAWRLKRAREDGVRAFIVFHDRTLVAIAEASPVTLTDLAQIHGVGPTKLDLYGDDVLDVVKAC
jgi:ATP-dependent DNA helicase UvrD/PcrA